MHKFREVELISWPRKKLFEHFKRFVNPCFDVTCKLDVADTVKFAKDNGESLFLVSLYAILKAANSITEMRLREVGGKVIEFEQIDAYTPIIPEGCRNFIEIRCAHENTFSAFKKAASERIAKAKNGELETDILESEDIICATCNPWYHFEAATFANYSFQQTMPLIAWGKTQDGRMPLTLRANHCFIDGLQVGEFYNSLQKLLSHPADL